MKIEKITSLQNPLIKDVVALHQKKYRETDDKIIVEGKKAIEGAISCGLDFLNIFLLEKSEIKMDFQRINCKIYEVNSKVMEKISTTESAPKILAIVKTPKFEIKLNKNNAILLENIKDMGNLGTIIRTASAFGVKNILLYGDCVEAFSPKVIRASVGEIFKVKIKKINKDELLNFKKTHKLISTILKTENTIDKIDFKTPTILMFGSEATGLSEELLKLSDNCFKIPMKNDTESLNLSISVGICLWEMSK